MYIQSTIFFLNGNNLLFFVYFVLMNFGSLTNLISAKIDQFTPLKQKKTRI